MNYKKFTVTDFICDEYFQDWIIRPDEHKNEFWNKWTEKNPDKKEIIERARKVLLHIQFKEDIPTQEQVQNALAKNLAVINAIEEANGRLTKIIPINRFRHLRKIAAIFIGVILIGASVFYYNWRNATTTIATKYGELKHLILPDGTEITLNAKSSVTYLKHWRSNHLREVQLTGEAFFEVTHLNKDENNIKNSERFIVATSDLKVEVLGTTFDVKNRRGKTNVVLKTGKVKVAFNNNDSPDVIMLPGEMVAYETRTKQVKKLNTDPEVQTAWVDKKIILQDATVQTIIEYLEDNYGYKVVLKDTVIGNKKMEGTLLLDNLPDVLFVLSTSLDIKISKKDSTLIFSK
jgi:ferric-dicitrate binding protein FerR (iron transport regulator)